MPIIPIYKFICDNCGKDCYLSARKKHDAIHHAKRAGVIVKGGKQVFCNNKKKCLNDWRNKK